MCLNGVGASVFLFMIDCVGLYGCFDFVCLSACLLKYVHVVCV